jgi:DNA-binding transcriptional regulator YdaS (Cro superfamily)
MRDDVISRAILAAGGPTALTKALGIRLPSVYSWQRIPAQRVLKVEEVTGIPRHELRPDLYPAPTNAAEAA